MGEWNWCAVRLTKCWTSPHRQNISTYCSNGITHLNRVGRCRHAQWRQNSVVPHWGAHLSWANAKRLAGARGVNRATVRTKPKTPCVAASFVAGARCFVIRIAQRRPKITQMIYNSDAKSGRRWTLELWWRPRKTFSDSDTQSNVSNEAHEVRPVDYDFDLHAKWRGKGWGNGSFSPKTPHRLDAKWSSPQGG